MELLQLEQPIDVLNFGDLVAAEVEVDQILKQSGVVDCHEPVLF
jgi:hypothetical protein